MVQIRNAQILNEGSNDVGDVVFLDATGKLPALSAENLTNINAATLTGVDLSAHLDEQLMPAASVVPSARAGELNFLPINIDGDFTGSAIPFTDKQYFMFKERDGSLIGLRPGHNGNISRYFLMYATDGIFANTVASDFEYRPPFLAGDEVVSHIFNANSYSKGFQALIHNTTNNTYKEYWIEINGTMDPSFHTFIDITGTNISHTSPYYAVERIYEFDLWAVVYYTTGQMTLSIYDNSYTLLHQQNWVNVHHTGSDINYVNYQGVHAIDSTVVNYMSRANLQYYVTGNTIRFQQGLGIYTRYSTAPLQTYAILNMLIDYNVGTGAFDYPYPLPYTFDPNIPQSSQVYPIGDLGVISPYGRHNGTQLLPDGSIYSATSYGSDGSRFRHGTIATGQTWEHHIDNWGLYGIAEWNITPIDASVLGKSVNETMWLSDDIIVSKSRSRLYNESATTTKTALNYLVDSTTTELLFNGTNALLPPLSTIENGQVQYVSFQNLSSVIKSDGSMWMRYYDSGTRTYSEFDGSSPEVPSLTPITTLPSNYDSQIHSLIGGLVPDYAAAVSKRYNLMFLTGNVYVCSYAYYNSSTVTDYFGIMSLTLSGGTTFVVQSSYLDIFSYTGIGIVGWNRPGYAVFVDSSNDHVYVLAPTPYGSTLGGNNSYTVAMQVQISTGITLQRSNNVRFAATWNVGSTGIHPHYGPYVVDHYVNDLTHANMYYRPDATVNVADRMRILFTQLVTNNVLGATSVVILTIQPPKGFIVFVSEFPVFMNGSKYTVPTQSYDLAVLFGVSAANNTYNIYVQIDTTANIIFDEALYPNSVTLLRLGTVTTGATGVTSVDVSKVSAIGTRPADDFASKQYYFEVNANGTPAFMPSGWSSTSGSAGVYTITHNLNTTQLGHVISPRGSVNGLRITNITNSSFDVHLDPAVAVDFFGHVIT